MIATTPAFAHPEKLHKPEGGRPRKTSPQLRLTDDESHIILRWVMAKCGLNQADLAGLSGTNQATISRWLSGTSSVHVEVLRGLVNRLPLTATYEHAKEKRKGTTYADALSTVLPLPSPPPLVHGEVPSRMFLDRLSLVCNLHEEWKPATLPKELESLGAEQRARTEHYFGHAIIEDVVDFQWHPPEHTDDATGEVTTKRPHFRIEFFNHNIIEASVETRRCAREVLHSPTDPGALLFLMRQGQAKKVMRSLAPFIIESSRNITRLDFNIVWACSDAHVVIHTPAHIEKLSKPSLTGERYRECGSGDSTRRYIEYDPYTCSFDEMWKRCKTLPEGADPEAMFPRFKDHYEIRDTSKFEVRVRLTRENTPDRHPPGLIYRIRTPSMAPTPFILASCTIRCGRSRLLLPSAPRMVPKGCEGHLLRSAKSLGITTWPGATTMCLWKPPREPARSLLSHPPSLIPTGPGSNPSSMTFLVLGRTVRWFLDIRRGCLPVVGVVLGCALTAVPRQAPPARASPANGVSRRDTSQVFA